MRIQTIPLKAIRLGERRPINKNKLDVIKESIKKIGLKTPPTVRPVEDGKFKLVAGHHRIEALKELERKRVRCFVIEEKSEASLWMIAENLHRAELRPQDEAKLLKEWERLLRKQSKAVRGAQPGGHQPHDRGISKTAKSLGTTREKVRRMRTIGNISKEASAAAEEAGLGLNKEALIEIGTAKTPKAQLEKVRELTKSKAARPRRGALREQKQVKRLKTEFKAARQFRAEWRYASVGARKAFIKTVLKPNKI